MKAFLAGLIFLLATAILVVIGVLLFPFLILLAFLLRLILGFFLIIFAIWLLGKFIILVWEKLNKK